MKLLEDYIKALEELEKYFGIDNLNYYALEIKDDYFSIIGNTTVGWADTEKDLEDEDGKYYESDIIQVVKKEELTAILIRNDFGGDNYWAVFKTENKREY